MAGRVIDHLSALPDELLHHILSFLPDTKSRARTSLLSSRYRHLWTHHPSLHLPMPYRRRDDDAAAVAAAAAAHVAAVDSCLRAIHTPTIHHLTLDLWLPARSSSPAEAHANAKTADRWLREAARRSVRVLHLSPRAPICLRHARIPPGLFSCHRSLVELNLSFSPFPDVPANFPDFGSLKRLFLGLCPIESETLTTLLSGCPLLESLTIAACYGVTHVEISLEKHPRLVDLILTDWWTERPMDKELMCVSIEAPNLMTIRFIGDLGLFSWKGSPCLVMATLKNISGVKFRNKEDWMRLVRAVSNARILEVNHLFYQYMITKNCSCGSHLAMFKNLKKLNICLDWVTGSALHALTSNLGECPLLEELYVDLETEAKWKVENEVLEAHGRRPVGDRTQLLNYIDEFVRNIEENYEEDGCDPSQFLGDLGILLPCLKSFTLKEFIGTKNEMRLVSFLFGNAVALEKFVLFDFVCRKPWELAELFNPLPKASLNIQMKLSR